MAIEKCYWQQYILSGISGEPFPSKEDVEKKIFISFFVFVAFNAVVVVLAVAAIAYNAMILNHKFMRYETVALVWI